MDNVSEKIDKWLGEHPEYAFLIFIGVFLLVLFGYYTQLEMGLGTSYSRRVGTGKHARRKDIPFLERCVYDHFNHHLVVIYCTTY